MQLRFIDLFCGIGGFRVALERRGHTCVFSSEINEKAQDAYEANFGERPQGDITQIDAADIPEHDVICGGFPCQPFSIAGKMEGLEDSKGRGNLFEEILRIARYHKPKIMILENVKNLRGHDKGKTLERIHKELRASGYHVASMESLNASHYGVPQARERIFIVCIRQDLWDSKSITYEEPKPENKAVSLEDILEDNPVFSPFERDDLSTTLSEEMDTEYKNEPIRVAHICTGRQGERIYSVKGHAVTQSAQGGGVGGRTGLYRTPHGIRRLTVLECKRVMGFPDDHVVSEGLQGASQLGNAVVPAVVEHVLDGFDWWTGSDGF